MVGMEAPSGAAAVADGGLGPGCLLCIPGQDITHQKAHKLKYYWEMPLKIHDDF